MLINLCSYDEFTTHRINENNNNGCPFLIREGRAVVG